MRDKQKNKNHKTEWTPEFAYVIGLLATDGNLSKDGRHIDFTSSDIQLIKTFKKCMNLVDVKTGVKTDGVTDKKYFRVQFSNAKLYQYLLEIGLTPNKSKTISMLNIPDKYFFDFLRGCFDGDGTIYSFWDNRWHSSFMFYITFPSASSNFLKYLQMKIKNFCDLNGSIGACGKNIYILRYAKKESAILFDKMFYSKNLPSLKRKYVKAQKIFRINANHNNHNNYNKNYYGIRY